MDVRHYVNSPAAEGRNSPENRENSNSGLSRVFWVAGVGFGLLCIVHSAINISLRIQGYEFCNKSVEFEQTTQCCPPGWKPYKSSCYQMSTERHCWTYAKRDCEAKGSHLVIINDEKEKEIVRTLGSYVVWVGLRAEYEHGWKTWKWLDGSPMDDTIHLQEQKPDPQCANLVKFSWDELTWTSTDCADRHQWMCEMELK